jgi:hypothetical protein
MRSVRRLLCVLAVASGAAGCATDRSEERESLERQRQDVRDQLDRNAPVGSRWAAHRDTQTLLGEMDRLDKQIRELDK